MLICSDYFLLNFIYYYDIYGFKQYDVNDIYSKINQILSSQNIYGIKNIKDIDLGKSQHVIYLDAAADFSYPNNGIKSELDANYDLVNKYKFYEIFNIFEYRLKQ